MKRMTIRSVEELPPGVHSDVFFTDLTLPRCTVSVLQLGRWLAHFTVDFTELMASALQEESAPPVRGRRRSRGAEDS